MRLVPHACWCGAAEAAAIDTLDFGPHGSFPLLRCRGCGVYALDPAPTNEQLAHFYSSEYYGASRKKFIGPIAGLVGWFQQGRARLVHGRLPGPSRILDIGCGNGGFLIQMKDRGHRAEGTEWTQESAARVPSEAGIPVHVGDLLDLGLPDGAFQAATLWHVFEHLRQPAETLDRLHRLLAPGGLLFLSMPNHESTQADAFGTMWFHLDPPRHLFGFGVNSLSALLKAKGFDIVSTGTWSMEQNPYGIIQSLLNGLNFPRDRAYAALKGTSAAPGGQRLLDLGLVALFAPGAIAWSILESLAGRGGTMTVVARKR